MEQSREERVTDPDQSTDDCYGYANDTRIRHDFFSRGPGHFFHLCDYFVQELLHNHFTSPFVPRTALLLRFLMHRMLLAELAVLIELQTIRVVLLVLVGAVVAAMALRALQRDIVAHPLLHPLRCKS